MTNIRLVPAKRNEPSAVNRQFMAYSFMVFILIWYGGTVLAVKYLGVDTIEGVGLGTAGGVFIKSFSDMWFFLWRKASPSEGGTEGK